MSNNFASENAQFDLELQTTGDGSHTLYRTDLDETYHSHKGALGESEYVFIEKGLEHVVSSLGFTSVSVFEVGLGTGLNALLTARFALEKAMEVNYHTLEPFPVPEAIYRQLNYTTSEADEQLFLEIHKSPWEEKVTLREAFHLYKYQQKLEAFSLPIQADVVYFDAFAPSKQAEVWMPSNLEKCFGLLNSGGVLVTYCAQGQFKRDIKAASFELEVLSGALGKKEMIRAIKP